jgi:hypothetical protein
MDNKIFNVNGKDLERFHIAMKLFLMDEYQRINIPLGWSISKTKGFILHGGYSSNPTYYKFPQGLTLTALIEMIWGWLHSEEAKTIELFEWEVAADHDGDNDLGWRIYTENWGRIEKCEDVKDSTALGAIKPCWCWYGK